MSSQELSVASPKHTFEDDPFESSPKRLRIQPSEDSLSIRFLLDSVIWAVLWHDNQRKDSDDSSYVVYPIRIAHTLAGYGVAQHVIEAAILCKVLQSGTVTRELFEAAIRKEVADLVKEVTDNKTYINATEYPDIIRITYPDPQEYEPSLKDIRVRNYRITHYPKLSSDALTIVLAAMSESIADMPSLLWNASLEQKPKSEHSKNKSIYQANTMVAVLDALPELIEVQQTLAQLIRTSLIRLGY